jgi:acyl-CoA synthetase (AMP-forming)/AMP-acid ligase II
MNVRVAELEDHCRNELAGYKIPKLFRFIESLPRNAGGKVLKGDLRDLARRNDVA